MMPRSFMPMQLSPCLLPNLDVYRSLFSTWCTADALMVKMNNGNSSVNARAEPTQQEWRTEPTCWWWGSPLHSPRLSRYRRTSCCSSCWLCLCRSRWISRRSGVGRSPDRKTDLRGKRVSAWICSVKEQTRSRREEPTWNTFLFCVAPNKQQQAAEDDQGSGSCRGTSWSWRSGILGDQLLHLSVQTDSSHSQIAHQIHENTEKSCFSKSGDLFLYSLGWFRVMQKPKQTSKMQTIHMQPWGAAFPQRPWVHNLSSYVQLGNSSVEPSFQACLTVWWRKAQIWISLNTRTIWLEILQTIWRLFVFFWSLLHF